MNLKPSWGLNPPTSLQVILLLAHLLHLNNNRTILHLNNNNPTTSSNPRRAMLPTNNRCLRLKATQSSSTTWLLRLPLLQQSSSPVVTMVEAAHREIIRWSKGPRRWVGSGVSCAFGTPSVGYACVARSTCAVSAAIRLMRGLVGRKMIE